MDRSFAKDIRPLIDLIDQLRDFGIEQENGFSLPQIAVMGDQSSGKSSVLQSISGVPFPRGSGLVTRCPTQLIMTKSSPGTPWEAEAHISWDKPQPPCAGKIDCVENVSKVIAELTDIITNGCNNSFSTVSIVVRLKSPEAPDLTIIDLPGIVRTATQGQDISVIKQVNDLINSYIYRPNTIILAVIPANQDIATVDIVERATKVAASRTIGVLTKPDLIGPGSEEEVVQVLKNIKKPLELGYVMLKNPSQKEVLEGISASQAKQRELDFFNNHSEFSKLSSKLFGMENLVDKLTRVLVTCIKDSLPELMEKITNLLDSLRREITKYGRAVPLDDRDKQSLVMQRITEYCKLLRLSSKGEYKEPSLTYHPQLRLHILVQQHYKSFQKSIQEMLPSQAKSSELTATIAQEIKGLRGRELPGFLSSQAFYCQVVRLVESWKVPVEQCKNNVLESTLQILTLLSDHIMSDFPGLSEKVIKIASDLAEKMAEDTTTKLESLISRELDPYSSQEILLDVVNQIRFRGFDNVLKYILDQADPKAMGNNPENLKAEIKQKLGDWYLHRHGVDSSGNALEMANLIQAYGDVSSRRLIDNICMCLEMDFMTSFVREVESQLFLFGIALNATQVSSILEEDSEKVKLRENLVRRIERLEKSSEALRLIAPEIVFASSQRLKANDDKALENADVSSDSSFAAIALAKLQSMLL